MDDNQQAQVAQLVEHVRDYARSRARDVARGAESPRLAALLIQKYGRGVADAAAILLDSPRTADPISEAVDEETAKIDPDWRGHDRERWSGRPADIVLGGRPA